MFQTIGVVLLFQGQQYIIKQEMSNKLNQESDYSKLQKVVLSYQDYQKNKIDDNEIYIQGKLYDIKTIIHTRASVTLFVCYDNLEEEIIENIKDFFSGTESIPSASKHVLYSIFSLIYIIPEHLICPNTLLQNSTFNFFSLKINDYIFYSDILTPPPEY